jgi:hypothetical protein
MKFTKTLIAAALLAVAAGAQAQTYSTSDEVLNVVDTTNGNVYSLDLGITAAALATDLTNGTGISATVSAASDANFASFVSAAGSDALAYAVEGVASAKVGTKTYQEILFSDGSTTSSTFSTTFASSTAGVANLGSAYANIVSELGFATTAGSLSLYAPAGWANTGYNTAGGALAGGVFASVGTALDFWNIQRTGATAITISDLAPTSGSPVDFSIVGTGSSAVGTLVIGPQSTSAVPLPTTVWMFLSGIVGVLSLKRRKHTAV